MEHFKDAKRKISAEKEPKSYDLNPSEPSFNSLYLGYANVAEQFNPSNGYSLSRKYAEQLLKEKKNVRKSSKVELLISTNISRGVTMSDPKGKQPDQTFHLQNIAFCTTIKEQPKVFAFIAEQCGKLQCHAFLCKNKDKSRALCLAVTRAFTVAHSEWEKKVARVISKKEREAIISEIIVTKNSTTAIDQDFESQHRENYYVDDYDSDDCSDQMMLIRPDRSAN